MHFYRRRFESIAIVFNLSSIYIPVLNCEGSYNERHLMNVITNFR